MISHEISHNKQDLAYAIKSNKPNQYQDTITIYNFQNWLEIIRNHNFMINKIEINLWL